MINNECRDLASGELFIAVDPDTRRLGSRASGDPLDYGGDSPKSSAVICTRRQQYLPLNFLRIRHSTVKSAMVRIPTTYDSSWRPQRAG